MVYEITGNWTAGLAFDLHTITSTYIGVNQSGHDVYDNTRSEMGELIFRLKYRNDQAAIPKIIELLTEIEGIETFDAIIPAPPSKRRTVQPVDAIAEALGKQRNVPVLTGYLVKTEGSELKGIDDPAERHSILANNIKVIGKHDISGKNVLIIDDLYRSGSTLSVCCSALKSKAKVGDISVLTMTKTRSNR